MQVKNNVAVYRKSKRRSSSWPQNW